MIKPKVKTIDVHQLKQEMDSNPSLCLIDVRELDEWQEGHISGAIHIPKSNVVADVPKKMPDLKQAIYLHCKGGVRSFHAAEYLIDLGYQEVYSIDGGIMAWAHFGYPVKL